MNRQKHMSGKAAYQDLAASSNDNFRIADDSGVIKRWVESKWRGGDHGSVGHDHRGL
jgi:hypothetical protein